MKRLIDAALLLLSLGAWGDEEKCYPGGTTAERDPLTGEWRFYKPNGEEEPGIPCDSCRCVGEDCEDSTAQQEPADADQPLVTPQTITRGPQQHD